MRSVNIKLTAVANEPGRFLLIKTEHAGDGETTGFEVFETEMAALARVGELMCVSTRGVSNNARHNIVFAAAVGECFPA